MKIEKSKYLQSYRNLLYNTFNMSLEESGQDNPDRELTIQEEYQLWRKNCRYMYEFVSETALTWPSLTVQWLPNYSENEGVIDAQLLLGTHTSGQDTNYLKLASTQLQGMGKSSDKKVTSRIKVTKKYENSNEINRARYQPQNSSTVATINGKGEVDIYDLNDTERKSVAHLNYHTANGYGLSWNGYRDGHLITSSDDMTVAIFDVKDTTNLILHKQLHKDIVNDVKWRSADLFGTVSDDKNCYIFDTRTPSEPVQVFYNDESKGINSLSFSPFSEYLIATGNANSNISLLDTRKLTSKPGSRSGLLHTMMGHSDSLTCLEFSPHKDGIIASGSQDRRVILWDLSKIGEEQSQEDAEDGCSELFMMHAGHTGAVMDLSWCPYKDWTLSTVADDNIVHLWEVGKSLLNSEKTTELTSKDLE